MSFSQLIILYLVGFVAAFYLGMRTSSYMWRKKFRRAKALAWRRGWDVGFGYLQKIQDTKTDLESSVRILEGERK